MNFFDYLKMEFIKDKNNDTITRVPIEDYCLNVNGVVHGGVTMSLIDNAAGRIAIEALGDSKIVTVDGQTNFLRPASDTKYLYAKCKLRKLGRQIVNVDCDVFDDDENLIAIGRFSFMRV